jgi:uncharacterized protein
VDYLPRIVDRELAERLESAGAVVIEGPKACGKTWTAEQRAADRLLLDVDDAARAAIEIAPGVALDRPAPLLLDEWQELPAVWNHVRRAVDERQLTGQFILTGSSTPADDVSRHSGAGRFSFLRMRPMCLFESGRSTGEVSLKAMFDGDGIAARDPGITIHDIAEIITRGGWPAQQNSPLESARRAAADYLEQTCAVDVSRLGERRRDPVKVRAVIRAIARSIASPVRSSTLASDAGVDIETADQVDPRTVRDYLDALERLMVLEDQPGWAPSLRSRRRVRSAPKRHLVDPSLSVAALGAGPQALLTDLNYLGHLFESLAIRDLRVLSQPLGGQVMHYSDNKGGEADAIIELADGRWAAIEVKLGASAVDQGADSLNRMARLITGTTPAFLAVVTGTGVAYTRPDGVHALPIGSLGP